MSPKGLTFVSSVVDLSSATSLAVRSAALGLRHTDWLCVIAICMALLLPLYSLGRLVAIWPKGPSFVIAIPY